MTIPPDGQILTASGPSHGANGVTAYWEFTTDWDSDRYIGWVTLHLKGDFEALKADGPRLIFSRALDGDTETLKVAIASKGSRLQVRIDLEVFPD